MIDRILRLIALSPPIVISLISLARVDLSNYYVAVGMASLLFISSTERPKWASVGLVYIPAIYTIGLLLTGSALPFMGLAAGYILASPLVLAMASYSSRSVTGIVSGYFSAYITSLLIYGAVAAGNAKPELVPLYLVRNLVGFLSRDRLNLLPKETPPLTLLSSLTAISTLALILIITTKKSIAKPIITKSFITALVAATAFMALGTLTFYVSQTLVALALLAATVGLMVSAALASRDGDA